ncbi:hypothetical protein C3941_09165 [Kaistia algarum]|uniref:EAL domain-containing protein n=1 Tax=Kaistia algarum TaxID=2083279 RepID=UPI000CE840A2|nr:EAL domain-containing protein [Kaistia algarum]MCX5512230.1 EAL domain-containing protein [Kaistia algarum]PPE80324.1 hypothetical protein C3941_09165 [Kaistia algarum]
MASFVEEIREDIEHATQYCDVRDLLSAWSSKAGDGPVELQPLFEAFRRIEDRLMVLLRQEDDFVYQRLGRSVVTLIGRDLTGLTLRSIDNPGVKLFRERYRRIAAGQTPSFCVMHGVGPSAIGENERLILPVHSEGRPGLLVYLRGRETESEILRSVFHASSDSISVIEAVRNDDGTIIDFRVVAVNAETARRLDMVPDSLIGHGLLEIWPMTAGNGMLQRFSKAVDEQSAAIFESRYMSQGKEVERELRLAPFGECLTVTNVDIAPARAASRSLEAQRNELVTANALLERRALASKASHDALQQTTRELREEIRRNKVLELELIHLARHDSLTGLPNRSYFEHRFDEALKSAGETGQPLALCVIDIDLFKEINDRFGHAAGDSVLREVSQRLSAALGPADFVGRTGGDEFAAILAGREDDASISTAVQRLLRAGMASFALDRQDVPLSISVGVAIYPTDVTSARELMAAADMAVYRAKQDGRGRPVFFEPQLRFEAERLYRLIGRLSKAIELGEIHPYYQPLLDLRTGQIIGFEALARWHHPEMGLISPARFSEALDVPDVAEALTRRMIDAVTEDLVSWDGQAVPTHVSVNVTGFDLRQPGFAAALNQKLAAKGLSSRQLAIEVTETTVLSRDADRISETLAELQRLGFGVALDDFGTGFASLSHLLKLPVGSIKIDRSFVSGIETSQRTAAVVRSLVSLAAALDLDIVAEGVETREQLDLLRGLGCHLVQGYLIAEPMPAGDVPSFTRSFALSPPGRRRLARTAP